MKILSVISAVLILTLSGVLWLCQSTPLVSVVLLTHNRQEMLPRAIDSILNQTYTNFELIIIDDASTDKTTEILKEYVKRDKRIKVIKNRINSGIAESRNRGLELAKGEYIAWQDGDDVSELNRLSEQVKFMEKHKDIIILGTQISLLGTKRMAFLWPTEVSFQNAEIAFLLGRLPVVMATEMWRKDFIEKYEIKFDKRIPITEDLPIYDQVLKYGGKIMTLNQVLYQYRLHDSNTEQYKDKIDLLQQDFFKARWNKFFGDVEYPKTQCLRLQYVKEHNQYFDQEVVDKMYLAHCNDELFSPTNKVAKIIHDDGTEELVIVLENTLRFYSNKLHKYGTLSKIDGKYTGILWD